MKKRLLSFAAGLVCLSCMASFALAPATVVKIADAELTVAQAAAVSKPGTVTGLKAAPAGKNRVKLTWSAVSGAEGYLVYAQKSGTYGYVGMTTKGTTYTDTKALDSDYNYYFVFAYMCTPRVSARRLLVLRPHLPLPVLSSPGVRSTRLMDI